MERSFYQFALSYRGGGKNDPHAVFAEKMFNDHSFPRYERSFDALSRYIEEKADPQMPSILFDELYRHFEDRYS